MKMDSKMLKLPSSWAAVKLGDFVENEKGKKPKNESKAETASHSIPYVDIQAFEENVIRTWTDGVGCRLCYETDFLMVWDGSRSGLVGKGMNGALGSTLVRIYFPSMVNDYAFYFLQSKYQQINTRAKGVGIPHVDPALLWNYDFPIAPLNEQHRIVAKIEELFSELDKGTENLKTARAQLKVYRQALLKHAFEGKLTAQWRAEQQAKGKLSSVDEALQQIKPIARPNRWKTRTKDTIVGHSVLAVGNPGTSLPEGWRWVPMVDIARMESGHTPSRNHSEWWGGDIPWISIPDARKNHGRVITDTVQKTNPLGIKNSAARVLPTSTVCVSRTASVGYVVELGKPMATSQDFVNWTPSEAVRPEWLRLIFGADREALLKFGKGTTHQTIYFPEWLSVHIGLPSIEEQKKIIEEVESRLSVLDQLELTITTSLQQAEALRQSILKKAFSGQLVAQDANDEPASVLLERIKAEREVQSATAKPRKLQKIQPKPAPVKTNVIPFPVKLANISTTDLHAGILARAYQHHEHTPKYLANFGHVKAEKIVHLVEAHLGIDLGREPVKAAAGPNDFPRLINAESRARKMNWFDVRKQKKDGAYVFTKGDKFDALLLKTRNALGERAGEVDILINKLLPLNRRQAEIVATLYAAWNNLLLVGRIPSDEDIVCEARENWHDSKLKIERDKFFRGLKWMREQVLVPAGKGRLVATKNKKGKS